MFFFFFSQKKERKKKVNPLDGKKFFEKTRKKTRNKKNIFIRAIAWTDGKTAKV